jgi:hypothetical protein
MKTLILTFLLTLNAQAGTYWQFTYKGGDLKIGVQAEDQESAFKKAAKECFKYLTKGVYPGESKGLQIIDICVNPEKIEKINK